MKKIVIVPDSFKGTLTSQEICERIAAEVRRFFPCCQVITLPVADGGEGSVDCFLAALGGQKRLATVKGPFFEDRKAAWGLLPDGSAAVLEMASCAGLPLAEGRLDPGKTTTYGVGQLLLEAAAAGAKKIILGLGGSATNDGGCGAAAACGVRFLDSAGQSFVPTGETLTEIAAIDTSGLDPRLQKAELLAMCDIDNPVYGPQGAAYIFAPQKGADPAQTESLDQGLRHLCRRIREDLGKEVASLPGGGAAGAMGAGMAAFFQARLQKGIETVLDILDFDRQILDADLIFTGEGRLDSQSLRGKVVLGVARRAARRKKPVIALVGGADYDIQAVYSAGITAVFPINRLPQDLSLSRNRAGENLSFAAENILRLLQSFKASQG